MKGEYKTKNQLLDELAELRQQVATLEKSKTKFRRVEEELKRSQERLKLLFEFAPDAYYLSDLKGNFIDGNRAAEELVGYKREELIGKNFLKLKLLSINQIPKAATLLTKNALLKPTGPDEFILNRKDRSQVTVEIRTHPIKIKGQSLVLGIARDITERKQAGERQAKELTAITAVVNDMLRGEVDDAQTEERVLDACLVATDSVYGMIGVISEHGKYDTTTYSSQTLQDCAFPEALTWEMSTGMTIRGIWGWPMLHSKPLLCNDLQAHPDRIGFPKGHVLLRCFLGVPLKRSGKMVGMVAVANKPGGYTQEDKNTLIRLASVMSVSRQHRLALIEAKRTSAELEHLVEERTKQLSDSEERFRQFFESEPEYCYMISTKGVILDVNNAALKALGYKKKELLGRPLKMIYAPESRPKIKQLLAKCIKTEKVKDEELVILSKRGSRRLVLHSAASVRGKDGKILHFVSVQKDITERKRMEEELRQREKSLAEAQRIAHLGNWDWDIVNNELRWSDEIYRIFGLAPQEFDATYEAFLKSVHPDDREFVKKSVDEALYEGKPYSIDHRIVLQDGSERIVQEQAEVFFDETGKAIRMVGTVQDITERKRAEEKLYKANRALKTISECSQALMRAMEESDLLHEICQIIVEDGGYRMAWVGLAEKDKKKSVRPVAQAGWEEGYLKTLNFTWSDTERGQGPTGTAIRTRKPCIVKNILTGPNVAPWRAEALKRGYASSIALPLISNGQSLGALNIYAVEPDAFDKDEVNLLMELANDIVYGLEVLQTRAERKQAEDELQQNLKKLRKALEGIIRAMAFAVEAKDPYTAGHQHRVADLARAIATEMGLSKDQIDGIRIAGVIHDIGKITVPGEILSKPSQLSEHEFEIIKTHPQVSYEILKQIEFPWPVAQIVLQHHERMDGSGYPQGLSGEDILLEARILGVADVVEAMSSHRPYRPSLGLDKALKEISQNKGHLYDSMVVDACMKLFKKNRFRFKQVKRDDISPRNKNKQEFRI